MPYTLRVFRKPIQGKQMELEKKLLEFRKLLGVQGNGALTRGYLNINGPVTHMLQFETLSEIQDYFSRSSELCCCIDYVVSVTAKTANKT